MSLTPQLKSRPRSALLVVALSWCPGAAAAQVPPQPETLIPPPSTAQPLRPLPQVTPAPAPSPQFALPPVPAVPPTESVISGGQFILRGVRFEGNKAIAAKVLDDVAAPYIGRQVGTADLEELRRKLTLAYVERGYITSGVVLPDQKIADGIVTFRVVEGVVTNIDVTGTKHLNGNYVSDRLERGIGPPVNIGEVERQLQILLQDPNIQRMNVELLPGVTLGQSTLRAATTEADRYTLTGTIANDQPPSVGPIHGELDGTVRNLIGWGDALGLRYGRTQGLNDGGVAWAVPVTAADTVVNTRFDYNNSTVQDAAFQPLDVTSTVITAGLGVTQPVYRTAQQTLTLGIEFDWRESRTYLLGEPFSFTPGVENGLARATVLRLSQDWLDRELDQVIAARSTFNVGLPVLGATVTSQPPTGRFLSWLGQFQYVRRVIGDAQAIFKADVQLAKDPLFSFEQIAIGGANTVRGYRENTLVTDNGTVFSLEGRIPIFTLSMPRPFGEPLTGPVQLAPFTDYGRGWSTESPTLRPDILASVGLGLRWDASDTLFSQLYYGYAIHRFHPPDSDLEDSGIHFRVTMRFF